MTRQNIFTILKSKYDICKEIDKIMQLFNANLISYDNLFGNKFDCNIEQFVDAQLLKDWKQRNSYLNCKEIRYNLGIKSKYTSKDTESDCIILLEYYNNLIYLVTEKFDIYHKPNFFINDYLEMLMENIKILLEHLNYDLHVIRDEEKVILIPKNPAATAVAEISSEDTSIAILMYNHVSLKGDLVEKRKLLNSIAIEYEPLLKSPINGYKDFFDKTNALLNNLHIRHNNLQEKNNKNLVINFEDKDLEKWYDELYQLLLFCVLIKDNLERKKNVEDFLKSIKGVE